jgi:hypothetical protein
LETLVHEINTAFAPISTKKATRTNIENASKLVKKIVQPLLDHLSSEEQSVSPVVMQMPAAEVVDLAEKVKSTTRKLINVGFLPCRRSKTIKVDTMGFR